MDTAQTTDSPLGEVVAAVQAAPSAGSRFAGVFRRTFDQLYDGQRTGRYAWHQLYKTEKTHYGTLVEINMRREFGDLIEDGDLLDFKIHGHEIDCKYSFRFGGWMLPPECWGELLLVCSANDAAAEWSVGVVRARPEYLRGGANRDGKTGLNDAGRAAIEWIFWGEQMPANVLLQIDPEVLDQIMSPKSGQKRVNELFRLVTGRVIGRNTVATVAQQDDYMKRVRSNGGARSALAQEGILIAGGDYESHRAIARELNLPVPSPGEFVSAKVAVASADDPYVAELGGQLWRVAGSEDPSVAAPVLPSIKR
jgi:hypothetical protein